MIVLQSLPWVQDAIPQIFYGRPLLPRFEPSSPIGFFLEFWAAASQPISRTDSRCGSSRPETWSLWERPVEKPVAGLWLSDISASVRSKGRRELQSEQRPSDRKEPRQSGDPIRLAEGVLLPHGILDREVTARGPNEARVLNRIDSS